ncbi:hypothetical protein GIB67_005750 [Kingdonia uniflora]|uniref:Nucleolar complex protein 2 homolog n=1 Tax=Kingdonia uniflora TaxID=39325 RepID=A0A7J7KVK0_9MAGN|nr:hypothetical protein GIB67_005750 [Kingdonia uniflora]
MGKLGKKARKFAKKNLQSVDKRQRKLHAPFRKKTPRGDKGGNTGTQAVVKTVLRSESNFEDVAIGDTSLDFIFNEDDSDLKEDDSGSDGYLSEDSSYVYNDDSENDSDENGGTPLLGQNNDIHLELAKQKRKLDRLKEKDPNFLKFLENHDKDIEQYRNEESYSNEGEGSDDDMVTFKVGDVKSAKGKVVTSSTIDSWCKLVLAEENLSAIRGLLNAYRTACHYGFEDGQKIKTSETFYMVVSFMLRKANGIFQRLLDLSTSTYKSATILKLKNTSRWKTVKPLIKSYLRSTLFLLNQVTDCEILVFTLTQLGDAIIYFAAFQSLEKRLIEVAVHLWATGRGSVSSSSFLIMRNICLLLHPECLRTCLRSSFKAFMVHNKFVDSGNLKHIQFLVKSLVELCSIDVSTSFSKALVSVQQLAKIMQHGLKTKKKELLKKISSWQYMNCIGLWVEFISMNIKDHDLQTLLYLIIQVINGVAHLFPGSRYFPLRRKCVQMLSQLSNSSGIFIPITSLVLDSLEYAGSGKPDARSEIAFDISVLLKVPKQWLKSQVFHEEIVLSVIELLSAHFSQWSYHISFPDLATISLIRLRIFHEKITSESLRRPVKRLIDQVQQNTEFVQKKREEVAFSLNDQNSVESFFQLKTSSKSDPFTQYYASVIEKSQSRHVERNISAPERKKSRKQPRKVCDAGTVSDSNGARVGRSDERKPKKQKT